MGNRLSEFAASIREMIDRLHLRETVSQLNLAGIVAALLVLTSLFAIPGNDDAKKKVSAADDTQPTVTATAEPEAAASAAPTKAPTGPAPETPRARVVANPNAELDYAASLAAQIHPVSTSLPNGNPNTWAGVTKDTIKFVFAYDKANCGTNIINALSAAGANFASEGRYFRAAPSDANEANAESVQAVNTIIQYYNDQGYEAAQGFPHIKPLAGNDPTHPFYGRRVVHEFVDGGSFQCPETTTAAAVEIAQDRKPFVVFNNFDGAQYNMAEALHAKAPAKTRPMHFGSLWLSDKEYQRWAPYVWTQFTSGTKAADLYASYICAKLVGKKAAYSSQYAGATRKFGLLYPDLPEARAVASDLRASVKKYCGSDIYGENAFAYATDLGRAAEQGTTIAVNFKLKGVTSVTYLMDPVFPLFQILAAKGQTYRPEYVFTPTGYMDSSTVQRIYDQEWVNGNSIGLSSFGVPGGFGYTAGDSFYIWHDRHKKAPSGRACDPSSDAGMNHDPQFCKAPGAIVTWLYTTLPSLAGILFAGPDLKPANVTTGLQRAPQTRYGAAGATQDPFAALIGGQKGKHYFIIDAVEWRWRSAFVSPPPENKLGWVQFQDCQRHYTQWPDGLAVNWEKNGPNYSKWCGDAKWAPKPYQPSGPDGQTCADTPSGKCENDGYPHWQEW